MVTPTKTLILIRHAHRDNTQREIDNGLSEKGHKQVQRLVKYFQKRFKYEEWKPQELVFESSAKLRCVQTLEPLAQLLQQKIKIHPGLMEQSASESFAKFQTRIQAYIKEWVESPHPVRLVSSHGDVLPIMAFHLVGAAVDFKKAGFLELEWESGQAHLRQVIPSLKPFFD